MQGCYTSPITKIKHQLDGPIVKIVPILLHLIGGNGTDYDLGNCSSCLLCAEKTKTSKLWKYEKLLMNDFFRCIFWFFQFFKLTTCSLQSKGMNAEIRNLLPETAISGQPEQKMSKRANWSLQLSDLIYIVEIQCNPDMFRRWWTFCVSFFKGHITWVFLCGLVIALMGERKTENIWGHYRAKMCIRSRSKLICTQKRLAPTKVGHIKWIH